MVIPSFQSVLEKHSISLVARGIDIFQMNLGKMCNLSCKHCHVEAGPNRKEIMTKETMQKCLELIDNYNFKTIDLTGGTPEANPNFRWFIQELGKRKKEILVRSNLVILLENDYADIVDLLIKNKVTLIVSFPDVHQDRTDRQRGRGVFDKLISIIKKLNSLGYGKSSELLLHLVHNPVGAYIPANQATIETEYKRILLEKYDIIFNSLFCITNMPIGRYLNYLKSSGNYLDYMEELVNAFNPIAAKNVMCTKTLSIGYDGSLYDCDFNQMLDITLDKGLPKHINDFDFQKLANRKIVLGDHCYGCAAGSGSSCQGATV